MFKDGPRGEITTRDSVPRCPCASGRSGNCGLLSLFLYDIDHASSTAPMGQPLEYPGIVNIVTLIVFFVYIVLSLYLILRQGLGRSWPWIWITILCVCRLVQVSMDLATTQLTPIESVPNTSVSSGVAILTSMGLTPLFMCTSSLLNSTTKPKGRRMQWILLSVHVPLIISFILIIAGGIDPDSREGPTYAATEATKAGISLYIVCFLILIWATAVISARLYLADSQEVKILTTVVLSLPFFVVDIVYMTCFAFESWVDKTSDMKFNVISGNVTIQLCMYVSTSLALCWRYNVNLPPITFEDPGDSSTLTHLCLLDFQSSNAEQRLTSNDRQVIMEYIVVGLYLLLGLELPTKAARLREQIEEVKDMSADQIQETILWKLHEAVSRVVAAAIMPALQFSHWMLGKILRSGQTT